MREYVEVTDHALIRWLERVHGIPMEEFRKKLADVVRPSIKAGAIGLQRDGMLYTLVGPTLVTVTPGRRNYRITQQQLGV